MRLLFWLFVALPLKILFLPIRMFLIAPLKVLLLIIIPIGAVVFLALQAISAP